MQLISVTVHLLIRRCGRVWCGAMQSSGCNVNSLNTTELESCINQVTKVARLVLVTQQVVT